MNAPNPRRLARPVACWLGLVVLLGTTHGMVGDKTNSPLLTVKRISDAVYQERYMGLFADSADGYRNGSPLTFASHLRGNFLLFIGTQMLRSAAADAAIQSAPRKDMPRPGEAFLVDGHAAFIIPAKINSARRSVCNIASYPGIAKAAGAYEMKPEELEAHLTERNPIDRLASLARAGVPFFAIHGDADAAVPLEANSVLVKERYTALGGSMHLIIPPGQGHNMRPGFFQSQELVSFVKAQAGPNITMLSPLDHQVIQRSSKKNGSMLISGELASFSAKSLTVEARLIVDGQPGKWRQLTVHLKRRSFEARWDAPAGGWHRLEVRALSGADVLAETVIEHVGVGEVFVIAGQSNSANHGAEKQNTKTSFVAAFDGQRWRPANDPQPGASGGGGSFIPPFGDAIAERFHVPIGIVACGVGATSVREWLPKGAKFPNPPTLTGHVQQLPDGEWESKGSFFTTFSARMKQLGPRGFRAVLWHQGESDANQADPTRTLPGNLYREYLVHLIRASRREIGWNAPWFVAQVSYHVPGDEASPDIRAAQAGVWKNGLALEGPDSDGLKGDLRENGGKGVHFSGPGLREHAARWVEKIAPWLEKQ